MARDTERVKQWREEQAKAGGRAVNAWLKPEAAEALDYLAGGRKKVTSDIINRALIDLADRVRESNGDMLILDTIQDTIHVKQETDEALIKRVAALEAQVSELRAGRIVLATKSQVQDTVLDMDELMRESGGSADPEDGAEMVMEDEDGITITGGPEPGRDRIQVGPNSTPPGKVPLPDESGSLERTLAILAVEMKKGLDRNGNTIPELEEVRRDTALPVIAYLRELGWSFAKIDRLFNGKGILPVRIRQGEGRWSDRVIQRWKAKGLIP